MTATFLYFGIHIGEFVDSLEKYFANFGFNNGISSSLLKVSIFLLVQISLLASSDKISCSVFRSFQEQIHG